MDFFQCRTSPSTPCSRSLVRCFVFSLRPPTFAISPRRALPSVNSWLCSNEMDRGLGCEGWIASLGSGCPGLGRAGSGLVGATAQPARGHHGTETTPQSDGPRLRSLGGRFCGVCSTTIAFWRRAEPDPVGPASVTSSRQVFTDESARAIRSYGRATSHLETTRLAYHVLPGN